MDKRVFKIRNEVAYRKSSDGNMTIVSPVTDKITTINLTATEIWEMIDGHKNVSEIIEQFYSTHSKDSNLPPKDMVGEDVLEILNSFLEKQLVELVK